MWEHLVRVNIAVAGLFLWCWPTTATAPKQDVVFRVLGTTEKGIYMQPMTSPQLVWRGPPVEKGMVLRCDTNTFYKPLVKDGVTILAPTIEMTCEGQRYELVSIMFARKD